MDLLIVNLRLLGALHPRRLELPEYCRVAAEATGVPIPVNYPVVGSDAFRTGTGVHAAAIVKARKKGDAWLADRVYSSVPAGEFGLTQRIDISPQSGAFECEVLAGRTRLRSRGLPAIVDALFQAAKRLRPHPGGRGVPPSRSRRRGWVRSMSATEDLYRSYLDLRWHFDPAAASATGDTSVDHRLGAFDAEAMRTHLAAFKSMAGGRRSSSEIDDTEEEIDRTAFLDEIRITVLRFET